MVIKKITKRKVVWTIIGSLILLIFLATQFTNFGKVEVQRNELVAYSVMLLAIGGIYELWRWLKNRNRIYRAAFGVGFVGMFLLGWVSGAIGIIGSENNSVNLMYWAVPTFGLIGSLVSLFKPRGMSRTFFAVALVQFSVPIVALIISPEVSWGNAGVIGVFIINSVFVLMFAGSALLFRRTSVKA